jgi:hypothetical protein
MKNLLLHLTLFYSWSAGRNTVFFWGFLDLDFKNGLCPFWRIDGWAMSSDRKMLSKPKEHLPATPKI